MRAVRSSSSLLSNRQTVRKMKKATFVSCFADDTSFSGLLKTEVTSYRFAVAGLVERYNRKFLKLNVANTGKIVVDFRRNKSCISTLVIKDEEVRIVRQYKYIGTIIDDRLEWTVNTEACYKKAHKRMYHLFLRKRKNFSTTATYSTSPISQWFRAPFCTTSSVNTAAPGKPTWKHWTA